MAIALEDMTPRAALIHLSAQIEQLKENLDTHHILKKIQDLRDYMELMDIKYDGLLKTVLIEFAYHREALTEILKGLGYEVDPIRGWEDNDWKEKNNGITSFCRQHSSR